MKETRTRSFAKGISYRAISTLATIGVVFFFTNNIVISLGAGAIEVIAKLIFYYFHERAWNHVSWGKGGTHENTSERE